MKKINKYDIKIPELGDRPDITVVSDAISSVGDATASAIEFMECSIQGKEVRLISISRNFKRSKYYDGMAVSFGSPRRIKPGEVNAILVDGLPPQPFDLGFTVESGEILICSYSSGKFKASPMSTNKSVASRIEMVDLINKYKGA